MLHNIFFFLLSFILFYPCSKAQFTQSELPIVIINTSGMDVPEENKLLVDMGIIHNEGQINHVDDPQNQYMGKIGIELRGQSSLFFPKKQYSVELRNEASQDIEASFLGLPENSDFVLSAPFSDKSLMRNTLSYILAGQVMEYAPRVRYCELVLNGDYQGVYVLTEKIKRSNGRLDLAKLKPEDIDGEELTGGYILRFDKYNNDAEILWISPFEPYQNAPQDARFIAAYPKYYKIKDEQKEYIQNYVTDFERALEDESFSYQGLHYSEFIDVETFVDFMLINELARNVDGYRLSSYMYKDKNAKMKMGPVWDFNLAFGNADYCNGSVINGWEWDFNSICDNDFYVNHFWWKRFLEDPSYVDSLRTRWWELRENEYSFDNICGIIDSLQEHIGVAATRNFERWPVLGTYIWPNNFVGNTYIEEVDYLKGWIKDRLEFIDDNIDELSMITSEIRDFNIWPNPTQGEITIGIGRYTPEDLTTVIFDNAGRVVKEIPMLHYSGEVLDLGLSSGLYFYALKNEKDLVSDVYKLIIVN